jgi:hypothetical protein
MVDGSVLTASIRSQSDAHAAELRQAPCANAGWLVTTLATQALLPAGTGRHWMKWGPHLSSHNGPGRVQLKGFGPTRNPKVDGSNPSSGSRRPARTSGDAYRAPAAGGHSFGLEHRAVGATIRYVSLRPPPGWEIDGGRHDICVCTAISTFSRAGQADIRADPAGCHSGCHSTWRHSVCR